MGTERFDVCIIGSGYGGSITAARLADAGRRVIVLERGPRLSTRDFRQTDSITYIQQITDYVIASTNIAFRTGKMVGGASVNMDGAHYRMPASTFDVREGGMAGRRYWPDRYTRGVLNPYYDRAEAMLRIRQLAWTEISKAGGLFALMLDAAGASADRARMNYGDCLQCGFCAQCCIYEKKHTMLHSYIPLAEMRGAEFRAGCNVQIVEPRGADWSVRYRRDGMQREIVAPIAIVAAGGIHSPAILLRSRAGLTRMGPAADHVGRHFNNNGEHVFVGIVPPGFAGRNLDEYYCYKGMDNAGIMTFHWLESDGFTLHPGGGFEPTALASDFRAQSHPVLPPRSFGLDYKRFVERVYPHRLIGFSALGISEAMGQVVLRADGTPDIIRANRDAWNSYLDRVDRVVFDVGRRTGVTIVPAVPREQAGQISAHLLASCRMSERPEDGVVDPNCQVWGHTGLYVCDASVIPHSIAVNPALTISAIAERTADHILGRIM